jgi:TolA-binding protein
MRNRVKAWKTLLCYAVCAAWLGHAAQGAPRPTPAPPPPAGGITQAADDLAAQALDLLNNGKLKEAADDYTMLMQRYPNAGAVPEALFRLGYIQYVQGDYPGAIATLKRIVSPPASPEIKAAGDALIPQVLAAQAGKMKPGDPKRKAAFEGAIKQFDAFIKQYANSPVVENANYGKAVAAYQNQDYEGAAQSLRDNLKRFPTSESIMDSEDLLAVVLIAEATDIMRNHGDQAAAMGDFNLALRYLADIIIRHTDVALANDAQFQIGEVLFNRGSLETGAKKQEDLTNAMDAYRAVLPKDQMVQAQEARVQSLLPRLQQAVLSHNAELVQALQRLQDRENAKLEALKQAPDQTMAAQLRIAACYFLLQRYDEARVMLHFLQPFAEDDDQKKQIEYYLVLTYASQGITDKAAEAYNDFQAKHKGDPLGENLPLAMGAAFLSSNPPQPDKAIAYFKDETTLYPGSPLVNEALGEEANALIGLHRYGDALATYNRFLLTKPPADQAAQAEQGIALIYQQTGKLPDAIKQYQKVADTYAGTAQAEQSAFYAAGLETSVDMRQALPKLQDFVRKYPDGKFTAQAMMMVAQVQTALNDVPVAMQTYKDVASKFPKSEYGPQSYFARAAILGKQNQIDEMVKLMRDFIDAYPDSKDIFYAYDTIGQTDVSKGKIPDAIATYQEMVDKHADNPMAPTALYRTAELWRKQADALGNYIALNDAQRAEWNKDINSSIAAGEKVLSQFPESDQVGLALATLLADQQMLLTAKLKTPDDIDKYFHGLADKFASNPSAKSRILFTLATFTYTKDPAKALGEMTEAYNPALVYAPADLDLYGAALIEQGKAAQAYGIYEKIAKDYPLPAGTQPAQAQTAIQEAQATALFGMASALDKEGKTADAGKLYTQLKASYPWSPKVLEANYGIAKSLLQQNKQDDALKLLLPIVRSRTAPARLRARAFLLIGDIYHAMPNRLDDEIDSYLKTAAFYGGVADVAAEALWKGGQALEQQAAILNEQSSPKKSEQIQKAVNAYKEIVDKYSDSPFVQQAQERLNTLGAK